MAYLRHWYNGRTISVYQLADNVVLGRHPDCAIHLDDTTVSAQHARLCRYPEGFVVEDLGSTNGITVDGERVDRCVLQDGKRFALGVQEFEFLQTLPEGLDKTLRIKKSWLPGVYFAR
jgi:pSer/pThr/pTyr-binding forkhead associated (FHA) protein